MLTIKIDTGGLRRKLDAVASKQLPFALAQTLNAVGRAAIEAERIAMRRELDRPRPFTTQQGLRLKAARKDNLEAVVYIPPIQSRYLKPEIDGGLQELGGKRGVLRPIDQATDQYGNLPRRLLAQLKGRPDIFIGAVRTKAGDVYGVWQRVITRGDQISPAYIRHRGTMLRGRLDRKAGDRAGLKLLIRFSDPMPVKARYRFGEAALKAAQAMTGPELHRQLMRAIATAR